VTNVDDVPCATGIAFDYFTSTRDEKGAMWRVVVYLVLGLKNIFIRR
jgi:hypothetical protein